MDIYSQMSANGYIPEQPHLEVEMELHFNSSKPRLHPTKNVWNAKKILFGKVGWNHIHEGKLFQRLFGLSPQTVKMLFESVGFFEAWPKTRVLSKEDMFLANLYRCVGNQTFVQVAEVFGGTESLHKANFYKVLKHNIVYFDQMKLMRFLTKEEAIADAKELQDREYPNSVFIADGTILPLQTKNPNFYHVKRNTKGCHGLLAVVFVRRTTGQICFIDSGHAPGTIAGQETQILRDCAALKKLMEGDLKGFSIAYDSGIPEKAISYIQAIPKPTTHKKRYENHAMPHFKNMQIKSFRKDRSEIENIFGIMQNKYSILKGPWKSGNSNIKESAINLSRVLLFCANLINFEFHIMNKQGSSTFKSNIMRKRPLENDTEAVQSKRFKRS